MWGMPTCNFMKLLCCITLLLYWPLWLSAYKPLVASEGNKSNGSAPVLEVAAKSAADTIRSSNRRVVISGTVSDARTGEPVVGASVYAEASGAGTVTDEHGAFRLLLPAGEITLICASLGYERVIRSFSATRHMALRLQMVKSDTHLREVDIIGSRPLDENVAGVQSGVTSLSIAAMKQVPALLGEVDVVRSIKLLPGVSSIGEAATGFNVRGGSTDQNLVLLDGAPVFNTSHLFGFFSVFNPNAIDAVTLYRGSVPAQFGGRISSVLDVKQQEGDLNDFKGNGGIGVITGRLAVEGPIIKGKTSFLVAGRSSYSDWLLRRMPDISLRNSRASFYDLSAKVSHLFNSRNKLSLSAYRSSDTFGFSGDTLYNWGSTIGSLKYTHFFHPAFFLDVSGAYSHYNFKVLSEAPDNASEYSNGIVYKHIKADFTYIAGKHQINFGAAAVDYGFRQGRLKPNSAISQILPVSLQREHALESAIYWNDEIRFSQKLSLMFGLRYSLYANYGAGSVLQYQPGVPKKERTVTDTLYYDAGQIIKSYQGAEPRLSVKYNLSPNSAVKAGYNRSRQYIHLISNSTTISPTDSWKSSNTYIKPQVGDQVSVGYFRNFRQNTIETSIEGYYKRIQNLPDYKNGATLYLNPALEADLLAGTGRAYGVETLISKKAGRATGWLSYTYARTEVQIAGPTPEETINGGAYYPASFDKPHTLNLVSSYQLKKRVVLSANFTYSTGRPITAPLAHYVIEDYIVPDYGNRNEYRIPDYHRLDLSLSVLPNWEKEKKWRGTWNVSVYNVYARKNPYAVFFKKVDGAPPKAYRLAVVGVPLPSVSYDFEF